MLRAPGAPPSPPIYHVELFAAPPGERQVGVVQDQPQTPVPAPVAPASRAPVAPLKAVPPKTKAKPVPAPKLATPLPPTKADQAKPTTPPPAAGGGPVGGTGADVANVQTPGIDFPYQGYVNNIMRRVIEQFRPGAVALVAEVRFVIRRDGTVDPASIHMVTSSKSYTFDQQALGAIEAASKFFGALPPGFNEDILPVNFRFTPSIYRR